MTTVEDIARAIEQLSTAEFDRLRAWFEDHHSTRFDEKIARDAESGKLDRFAEQTLADYRRRRE